jgi:DnaK suppressor protein
MVTNRDTVALRTRLQSRHTELVERRDRARRDADHRDAPVAPGFAEQASQRENDVTLFAIAEVAARELADVDAALRRLDEGRYGRCEVCGEPIEPARLAARPESVACAGCAGGAHWSAGRERQVAEAAYYRAERRGFEPGCELDDWLAAEAEIDGGGSADPGRADA